MRFEENKISSDGTAGKCYLADEFPEVWKTLRSLYSHYQRQLRSRFKGATNILKHARPLTFRNWFGTHGVEMIDDEERIWNGGKPKHVLALARTYFDAITDFVHACVQAIKRV